MGKEMQRRFKELSEEGTVCLLSLANIDKRVGQAFLHLKEVIMFFLATVGDIAAFSSTPILVMC